MKSSFQDSCVWLIVNKLTDFVILSLLWCLVSLPLITLGMSTGALYHAVQLALLEGKTSAAATFLRSVKESFRQTLPMGAVFSIAGAVNLMLLLLQSNPAARTGLPPILLVITGLVLMLYSFYCYALAGHFVLTAKQILILALQLLAAHPLKSLLNLALMAISFAGVIAYPPLLLILPAGCVWCNCRITTPLLLNYINLEHSDSIASAE